VRLKVTTGGARLRLPTTRLMARTLSPLTGIATRLDIAVPGEDDPRVTLAVGQLTNVGLLSGRRSHSEQRIAGIADSYDRAMTAVLAETLERYALHAAYAGVQQAGNPGAARAVLTARYRDLAGHGKLLVPEDLRYFSDHQLRTPGFPFTAVSADTPIGWLSARSLRNGALAWLPAQSALLAYAGRADEPKFTFGVSTGTAAHTSLPQALRHAILELIQTDAAMGTWFGTTTPVPVRLDDGDRTRTVWRVIARRLRRYGPVPRFYWLPSPDLPAITVACVLDSPQIPRFAVGLGCHQRLDRALYKAFLESVAVAKLATVLAVGRAADEGAAQIDPARIFELDSNVAYYATAERAAWSARFGSEPGVDPRELPPDTTAGPDDDLRDLVHAITDTGKELVCLDLTAEDVREVGFRVVRVWSPDLLALSPPSAPPAAHPRFAAYGGLTSEAPHPYA
jgi:thiazole/oxazole-forming peptide maturase SagD family component